VITDLRDDIFYATVYLNTGGPDFQLDARPPTRSRSRSVRRAGARGGRVFDKAGAATPPRRPSI